MFMSPLLCLIFEIISPGSLVQTWTAALLHRCSVTTLTVPLGSCPADLDLRPHDHFVEIDRDKSEAKLLERFGAAEGPCFAVVNQDLEVKTTSGVIGSSKKFASFLQTTVKKHFTEYWGEIKVRLDEQKDALKEAKSLEKKKDITGALMRVREVTRSALRIGSWYDDAVKMDQKLTKKMTNGG